MSNYGKRDKTSVVGPRYEPINFLQHNYVAIGLVFLANAYNDYNTPGRTYRVSLLYNI